MNSEIDDFFLKQKNEVIEKFKLPINFNNDEEIKIYILCLIETYPNVTGPQILDIMKVVTEQYIVARVLNKLEFSKIIKFNRDYTYSIII